MTRAATTDQRFAAELARSAGQVLQAKRANRVGLSLRELRNAGDGAAQAHIAARLADEYPYDAVLSEEAPDSTARRAADRVWIIDPLDGTREYAEGRSDWAVHVALWERTGDEGGDLAAGTVAIPDEGLVLASGDSFTVPALVDGSLRIAVSRTRPPDVVHTVVDNLAADGIDTQLVPMGSAGVKISAVARGHVDAYLHAGGQYQWDSAAPVAVARAAGLHTSRIDGSPLVYNGPDPYLPDLLVCRAELSGTLLTALSAPPTGERR